VLTQLPTDWAGSIPPELGMLANLSYLSLYDGNKPGTSTLAELGMLTELTHCSLPDYYTHSKYIDGNSLPGKIPMELDEFFYQNSLIEVTPMDLDFDLSYNALSGITPAEFSVFDLLTNTLENKLDNNTDEDIELIKSETCVGIMILNNSDTSLSEIPLPRQ